MNQYKMYVYQRPKLYIFILVLFIISIVSQISLAEQLRTPVKIITVKTISKPIIVLSIGRAQGLNSTYVQTLIPGQIKSVNVSIGSQVKKGQVLATLTNEKEKIAVEVAQAGLQKSRALLLNQKKITQRLTVLYHEKSATLSLLEKAKTQQKMLLSAETAAESQLKNARINLQHTRIVSPISGIIQEKKIKQHSIINAGAPILLISNNKTLEVKLPLAQSKHNLVKIGQHVKLLNLADQGSAINTIITNIEPMINPETYSFNVICIFKNKKNWKAGSSVKAEITINKREKIIPIPLISIEHDEQGPYVYLAIKNKAIKKHIVVQQQNNNYAEVTSGIKNNDKIITEGASFLHNNDAITIVK